MYTSNLMCIGPMSGTVHTGVKVCRMDLWNDLGFSLCAVPSVCHVVITSDDESEC